MIRDVLLLLFPASLALALVACGGSSSSFSPGAEPTLSQRIDAATSTADNNARCALGVLGPFYWEIGDGAGVLAFGRVGPGAPTASTTMRVYSASKWLYAANVVQKHTDFAADVRYLNFTSGYSTFGNAPVCIGDTVNECLLGRDQLDTATRGRFAYDSGHMQVHAADVMQLGGADNAALTADLNATLGNLGVRYWLQQPASGVEATPAAYGAFLRRLLDGSLRLGPQLGAHKVCAQAAAPGCDAAFTPDSIHTEQWQYSLGHWVEDDPAVGDHAFSSPGGGGFYPWIDAGRRYYGVLARETIAEAAAGFNSAACGRLIRQAWLTGVAVSGTSPTP